MRVSSMLSASFILVASGSIGCSSEADSASAGGAAGLGGDSGNAGHAGAGQAGWPGGGGQAGSGQAGSGQAGSGHAGGDGGDAGASDAGPDAAGECGCFYGDGPYCSGRAKALAGSSGCTLPAAVATGTKLLKCTGDQWSVLEDCPGKCLYDAVSEKLDDECELPVCECFVKEAWCGSGVGKEAAKMNCRVPLLPAENSNILYCPGGTWSVKQECSLGCVEAPAGTADSCKTTNDYKAPYDCGTTRTCSNGNSTGTHTGKDKYAFDFPMPTGTTVRAMRGGKVHQVRYVSKPGSNCYNSGSSSCANYANTVEILHSDGSIGLYMHLSKPTVSKGQTVGQGAKLGESGNSGWSTGAHTHVQVQGNCGIWWCQSIPFKFTEDSTVSKGTSVKSQNCP